MAYRIERSDVPQGPVFPNGYGGLFSSIKHAVSSVAGAVGSVASPVVRAVSAVGRTVDVTSSRSLFGAGRIVAPFARQALATSAAVMTGGASTLISQATGVGRSTFGIKPTAQGFITGAVVGTAILGGKSISGAIKGSGAVPSTGAGPVTPPPTETTQERSPFGTAAAGAIAGLLVLGPPGAVAGGAAGYFLGQKKPPSQGA